MFEWEELSDPTPDTAQVYTHSAATLEGDEEGLLVDTGSKGNLTGLGFVTRQTAKRQMHRFDTKWPNPDKPKTM